MANNGEIFSIIQGYQHIHYQTKLDDDFKAQGLVSFHAVVGLRCSIRQRVPLLSMLQTSF